MTADLRRFGSLETHLRASSEICGKPPLHRARRVVAFAQDDRRLMRRQLPRPQRGRLQGVEPVVEMTALSFGRATGAVLTREQVLDPQLPGFLPFGGRREIIEEGCHQRRPDPRARNSTDHHGALHHPLPQLNRLPDSHVPRGLRRSCLDRDFAGTAGGRGERAGLEEAHRPKPLVEPGGGVVGGGHSRKEEEEGRNLSQKSAATPVGIAARKG